MVCTGVPPLFLGFTAYSLSLEMILVIFIAVKLRIVIRVFDDGTIETFPIDVVVISKGESKYPVTVYSAEIHTKPNLPKKSENPGDDS